MPCKHILKIREIYRNPTAYAPQSSNRGGATIYSGWPERGFTLKKGDGSDFDFLLTTFNLCKHAIRNQVNACNCEGEDDIRWLRNRISELESEASNLESNSSTQLVLRRSAENSLSNTERSLTSVRTERDNLQATKRDLESRVSDLRSSNWSLQSTNSSLQTTNTNLQNQLTQKDRDIEWGKNQLALVQKSEREKQTKIDELTRQLTTLQITNNNINREISEKKNEIKNLKGDLNLSREEFLNQKIGLKEEKLETLVQQLGVNQGQIINLRNAYKQLIEARRNFNQVNINAANGNVNNIRVALVVNPADRQKICRKCEKLVKLEMELNQIYQQQFEARQEVPLHNN